MFKLIIRFSFVVFVLICLTFTGSWHHFIHGRMQVNSKEELVVKPGTTINQIAYQLQNRKIIKNGRFLRWLAWYRGDANKIKAGEYFIEPNLSPAELLQKLIDGRVAQYSFTLHAGWSFNQVLQALQNEKKIAHTLQGDDYNAITAKFINVCKQSELIPVFTNLEGLFWPDTYFYTSGTTDLELLHRAFNIMHAKLQQEWDARGEGDVQIKTPYEALILASILEKESSIQDEYYAIAGVYYKRLQQNMLLQADPTVIYVLKQSADFKTPLKKSDLKIESNYNTYKYVGLPPTPIAIPSLSALHAALHPKAGDALYFVADGRGGHIFSATLEEHNKAVAAYRKIIASEQNNLIQPYQN